MKKILLMLCSLPLFCVDSLSQTTFDIASFRSPAGWNKQSTENSIQFSTEDTAKGTYCLLTLLRSVPGTGDAKKNFNAAWQTVVKTVVNIAAAPQMFPPDNKEDWQAEGGFAPFEKDGEKGVAVLFTLSGHGKMVNVLVLTNTMDYEPAITAFLESVSLKKPAIVSQPVTSNIDSNASIVGEWGISVVVRSTAATSYSGTAGSTIKQYTFNADGTYSFASKTFSFSYDKLLLVKETGSYQISGSNLALNPQKSVTQAWSKKDSTDQWGKLLTTQNRPLEKTTYRFTKNYSNGMNEWQLVLQADKVTQRDGPFNGGTAFDSAWIYSPPCEKCLIELPR